jgi:hypothetical protein
MRMLTTDPAEVRQWADGRGARPGLTESGDLVLWMPGEADRGPVLRWDEFAGHFTAEHMAFVFDDMPGSGFWVIGREDEVRQFAEEPVPEMLA